MASKKVVMYTDGACSGNPGNGGWGAYIEIDDKKIELSGSENNTTNNRMELKAVINALDYLNEKRDIIIFTDSKYVMQGIQEWIKKWKINRSIFLVCFNNNFLFVLFYSNFCWT